MLRHYCGTDSAPCDLSYVYTAAFSLLRQTWVRSEVANRNQLDLFNTQKLSPLHTNYPQTHKMYHPFTLIPIIPSETLLSCTLHYVLQTTIMHATRLLIIPIAKRHHCVPLLKKHADFSTEIRTYLTLYGTDDSLSVTSLQHAPTNQSFNTTAFNIVNNSRHA